MTRALLAAATKPDDRLWGLIAGGWSIAILGGLLLALGVSRSKRTGKQSVPMAIVGIVLIGVGIAFMRIFGR